MADVTLSIKNLCNLLVKRVKKVYHSVSQKQSRFFLKVTYRLKALEALRKTPRIAPFPASRRLHLRVWKSTQLPRTGDGERTGGGRAIEEEEDTERKWSHVEASGRVESTLRENLGVRPGHIGFSGESWSMFPGSWLTRGIGYKATRPADWFILSATPAHTALSRNYSLSVCLSLSHFAGWLSFSFLPVSRCFYLSTLSVSLSLSLTVDNRFFPRRVLTCVSCLPSLSFDLRRKGEKKKIK